MAARVPLTILHDEGGVLVVDKPAGLESTGRTPDDPAGLQHHLQAALRRRLWVVHQLDRDTSGVLVFVRRRALVAEWQARLRADPAAPDRGAQKRYLAMVDGAPAWDARVVSAPLAYRAPERRWAVTDSGKPSRTDLRVLSRAPAAGLVEATLRTGRTHQARVHLAHLGHPLLGERRYREPPCSRSPRQALHAWQIELPDGVRFVAPLPRDLIELARREGLELPPSVPVSQG